MEGSCKTGHFLATLNPFSWSMRIIRAILVVFLTVMLPLYILFGLQPSPDAGAAEYPTLALESISLSTTVVPVSLNGRELEVPDRIAGAYSTDPSKIFLMGHSSTVFKNLHKASLGDRLSYDSHAYIITSIETLAKSEISMSEVLASTDIPTLIIMTCAGTPLPNRDATHRLIVTATIISD